MSILKGILHHWNKTTRNYDIIHPETESARVTDWNQGIVNTLASTALGGLVNTLTSDSLLAKMIQKVLTATGVKYSIAQNGYLCFGSLFGGLIIQWGLVEGGNNWDRYFNINFPTRLFAVWGWDAGAQSSSLQFIGIDMEQSNTGGFRMYTSNNASIRFGYIAIGF